MEDAVYFANILRSRECAVCGADRRASASLAATTCAICRGPVDSDHALIAIAKGAAKALCSIPCVEVALQEGLVAGETCPVCDSFWSSANPHARSCRTCAKVLALDAGYVGLFEAGRLQTFCSTACVEMHEARANPFCG